MVSSAQLKIAELFYSIQGESSYAGYPCFFIRLAGCNLRCTYCDTRYAYEEDHPSMDISRILAETEKHPAAIVEITGGEPLLQENVYPLMKQLLAANKKVLLESNGSRSLADVPADVIRIMDMKCPGSGMHEHMDPGNLDYLTQNDEVKFVLGSREDYDWAADHVRKHSLPERTTVTFSPVTSILAPSTLARWILDDFLPVRLRLQLHTIIWPDKTRGY